MVDIATVISGLKEDDQKVMTVMLARAGIPDSAEIDVLYDSYRVDSSRYNELSYGEKLVLCAALAWNRGRYAPKLNFRKRCEILALNGMGITAELLSRAYGIDRRTITKITRENDMSYGAVRNELKAMGVEAFRNKYVPQSVMDNVLRFMTKKPEKQKPNRYADRKAGPHVVRAEHNNYDHRVVIAWKNAGEPVDETKPNETIQESGWYYKDADGDYPMIWLSPSMAHSTHSSDYCYRGMLKDIEDRMTERMVDDG